MARELSRGDNRELAPEFASLLETESFDPDMTFALENERDEHGRPIYGRAFWVSLREQQGEESADASEGKLFVPKGNGNGSLVIFEMGMPGNSASWMERRHVPALLKEGYTSLVLRHRGTKTDSENAAELLNAPERIERGVATNRLVIGGERERDLRDIANESAVAMRALAQSFEKIKLVGHSAGALNHAYALSHVSPEVRSKVTHFISLSGFIGGMEGRTEAFGDLEGYYEYCRRFIDMGDPKLNAELLERDIAATLYHEGLPDHTQVVTVNAPQDEFFTLDTARRLQEFLGRGVRITDETQSEPDYHDLKNFRPETLVRMLTMYAPSRKHSAAVSRREPKG
ncbi:MAG: hypothetical protein HY420_03985 [Candidatus Kerfeldbacteria bacterium]|nr:hypothetical protein [Candidatus Kerfeldbacteria bacterium]